MFATAPSACRRKTGLNWWSMQTAARACARWPALKRTICLDLYVGEICPPGYDQDPLYSLEQHTKTSGRHSTAVISAKRCGSWTRFISHSCRPTARFARVTVGSHTSETLMSLKKSRLATAGPTGKTGYAGVESAFLGAGRDKRDRENRTEEIG